MLVNHGSPSPMDGSVLGLVLSPERNGGSDMPYEWVVEDGSLISLKEIDKDNWMLACTRCENCNHRRGAKGVIYDTNPETSPCMWPNKVAADKILAALNQHGELLKLVRDAEIIISVHAAVKPEGESNVHKTMDMWLERARAVLGEEGE